MLQGKKILLGVCGSIAAYKAALLVRLLKKSGAEVKVIMTASASSFITPLTLATLSKNPVFQSFTKNDRGEWNNHVELGLWADLFIIAPASANTIAKMANGLCDNLLTAVYLSARCPVCIAPAMDVDMYQHPSTTKNLTALREFGNIIIDAEEGELASGLHGIGRMAEPEFLHTIIADLLLEDFSSLDGKKVLITAGPTFEAIDPVRFIGNHSSGKMGFAIAEVAAKAGAHVTLISGPTALKATHPSIQTVRVTSAGEMHDAALDHFKDQDVTICAAAVADYTPLDPVHEKIKSTEERLTLKLKKTKDIAFELGKLKTSEQFLVGFALETENPIENAKGKLSKKNLDLIILNSLKDAGAGFSHNTNKITIIDKDNNQERFELKNKSEVAKDIIRAIAKHYHV